jgi:hypothetical protein
MKRSSIQEQNGAYKQNGVYNNDNIKKHNGFTIIIPSILLTIIILLTNKMVRPFRFFEVDARFFLFYFMFFFLETLLTVPFSLKNRT